MRVELQGNFVYKGIIVAPIVKKHHRQIQVEKYSINPSEIEFEFEKFKHAVELSKIEYQNLLLVNNQNQSQSFTQMTNSDSDATDEIVAVYIMLLEDLEFHQRVKDLLESSLLNAEWTVYKVIQEYTNTLGTTQNEYMMDRVHDLNEIGLRIINNIKKDQKNEKVETKIDSECIFIAKNLYTSQLLKLPLHLIKGIVLEEGGKTSHTAIIAKSYGIPMMIGVEHVLKHAFTGKMGIIDPKEEKFIINPDEAEILEFKNEYLVQEKNREETIVQLENTKKTTKDNISLSFNLNIDLVDELENPICQYADGIGLFRSEFLLELIENQNESEEQQFQIYKSLLEIMKEKPVVIRTFDVGGDKISVSAEQIDTQNPLLGYRGIRYCLHNKEFFMRQLSALLRASVFGNLQIMIPMVTTVDEIIQVHEYLEETKKILDENGEKYNKDIPIGIMIETPSVIYIMEELAQYCSFFSIGSNDLLQYSLAVDRDNTRVQYLYDYFQPSFLRIMRDVLYQANHLQKPISLCGELASVAKAQAVLLGAGLRRFSISPSSLADTIVNCCLYSISESRTLFEKLLQCHTVTETNTLIKEFNLAYNSDSR